MENQAGPPQLSLRKVPAQLLALLRGHRVILFGGFLIILFASILGMLSPLIWRFLVDDVLIKGDRVRLPMALGLLITVSLGKVVLARVGQDVMAFRLHRVDSDLRARIHEKLLGQTLTYLHGQRIGDLIQRATADVNLVTWNIKKVFLGSVIPLVELVSSFSLIAWLEWRLAALALLPILLGTLFVTRFNRNIAESYRKISKQQGSVTAHLGEDLGAIHVIKGFSRELAKSHEYRLCVEDLLDQRLSTLWQTEIFFGSFQILGLVTNLGVLCAGAYLVIAGNLTIGALLAIRSYWGAIWWPINSLAETADTLNRTRAAAERVLEVLDSPVTIRFPDHSPRACPGDGPVAIAVEEIYFAYSPDRPALSDVTFHVPPGTRVAIVGGSGAGKSTLLALLMRLYDPDSGRVEVNGLDLKMLSRESMSQIFAPVEQEPLLFARSIRENVAFARPGASQNEIETAVRLANAEEFVANLPEGYDTLVGERGVKLSGGQRQRLCIARAFLANPRVLLLDEATAAVEAGSEAVIAEALDRLMEKRTTLMATHKLHLARGCDEVLVIEEGRLVARGTHEELLASNAWYAQTAALQRIGNFPLSESSQTSRAHD